MQLLPRARTPQTLHDDTGQIVFTDTFTHPCGDCGRTIRVHAGRTRRHWCRCPRRHRGRQADAWVEGYEWGRYDAGARTDPPAD